MDSRIRSPQARPLVTNNERDFAPIERLRVEKLDWVIWGEIYATVSVAHEALLRKYHQNESSGEEHPTILPTPYGVIPCSSRPARLNSPLSSDTFQIATLLHRTVKIQHIVFP